MNETKKKIEELTNQIEEKQHRVEQLTAEIHQCEEERTALMLLPFHKGEKAVCTLPDNKKTKDKPFDCIIEISGDSVHAKPVKEDGTVSKRHYKVPLDDKGGYTAYLTKSNETN